MPLIYRLNLVLESGKLYAEVVTGDDGVGDAVILVDGVGEGCWPKTKSGVAAKSITDKITKRIQFPPISLVIASINSIIYQVYSIGLSSL